MRAISRVVSVARRSVLFAALLLVGSPLNAQELISSRIVASGLEDPFEILVAPDTSLWITERRSGRILRFDPSNGARRVLAEITELRRSEGGQDGLLGMVLAPAFRDAAEGGFVYLAHSYDTHANPAERRMTLTRWRYDPDAERLVEPQEVLSGLPAGGDHNGGRLVFGADGKLYYSMGDQGALQGAHHCEMNLAQELPTAVEIASRDWRAYAGKLLRLEPDGTIPADNPVLNGVRSHVYAIGLRNVQGIAVAPDGNIYVSDQGPKTDDEINLIAAGANYGWPRVAGYRDDQAYVFADWPNAEGVPCAGLAFDEYAIPDAVAQYPETEWYAPGYLEPILTFGTVAVGHDFRDPACGDLFYVCWPTVAPSSLAFQRRVTAADSLLMTTLKDGSVYRLNLTAEGAIEGAPRLVMHSLDRYRDMAVSADGETVYLITDSAGNVRVPGGGWTNELANPGTIIELRWRE